MYSQMSLPIQMEHERETIFSVSTTTTLPLPDHQNTSTGESSGGERGVGSLTCAVPRATQPNNTYGRDRVLQS